MNSDSWTLLPDYPEAVRIVASMPEEYQKALTDMPLVGSHLPKMIELCKEIESKL